ncbi:hypothetical protein C7I55_25830 [Sphingomonas deserti]|uniref:Uncharacterized protein n=1 Tax=Allosphingosinicella deserti TaxID=2116704 RepID=A0A2P7QEY4_9SPHN|nr:hypothetical protein C7I55_25830 [Sphingomonas deserti]
MRKVFVMVIGASVLSVSALLVVAFWALTAMSAYYAMFFESLLGVGITIALACSSWVSLAAFNRVVRPWWRRVSARA